MHRKRQADLPLEGERGDEVVVLKLPVTPQVKRRPRVTSKGVFPDRKDQKYEAELRQRIAEQYQGPHVAGNLRVDIFLGPDFMEVHVMRSSAPKVLRGDTDNYVKNVLDALQERQPRKYKKGPKKGQVRLPYSKGVFSNDSRVVEIYVCQTELEETDG